MSFARRLFVRGPVPSRIAFASTRRQRRKSLLDVDFAAIARADAAAAISPLKTAFEVVARRSLGAIECFDGRPRGRARNVRPASSSAHPGVGRD
jgi:hypothetical protein